MRIEKVSYQKIFPTGMAYLNHKIGVEIELDEEDNPDEAFLLAKTTVEKWNLESNPGMAVAMEYMGVDKSLPLEKILYNHKPLSPDESKEKRIGLFIEDINSCLDLKTLETYKLLVKGKPELQTAYDNKLKQLQ